MKQYDPAGVWERVQSTAASDSQSLGGLMDALWLETRVFQHLSGKLPPTQAAIARELSRSNYRQLSCLKGMDILTSGAKPDIQTLPVPNDPPELHLRRSYAQTLRLRGDYEARRNDAAYGYLFRALAQQAQTNCQRILELLGAIVK